MTLNCNFPVSHCTHIISMHRANCHCQQISEVVKFSQHLSRSMAVVVGMRWSMAAAPFRSSMWNCVVRCRVHIPIPTPMSHSFIKTNQRGLLQLRQVSVHLPVVFLWDELHKLWDCGIVFFPSFCLCCGAGFLPPPLTKSVCLIRTLLWVPSYFAVWETPNFFWSFGVVQKWGLVTYLCVHQQKAKHHIEFMPVRFQRNRHSRGFEPFGNLEFGIRSGNLYIRSVCAMCNVYSFWNENQSVLNCCRPCLVTIWVNSRLLSHF